MFARTLPYFFSVVPTIIFNLAFYHVTKMLFINLGFIPHGRV